jgi:hypothetical protein
MVGAAQSGACKTQLSANPNTAPTMLSRRYLAKNGTLTMHLPDALDAVLEPGEIFSAPVDRLLVPVDFTPSSRRRVVASDSVRQG